jgi:translation initiation factor 2 beta subunit (eIF-2beta)/eIF-5
MWVDNMLKNDKKQFLVDFLEKHQNTNDDEKQVINDTTNRINRKNQDKEILALIKALRLLSINGSLSQDGRILLKKLQRRQWIEGVLGVAPFFGR